MSDLVSSPGLTILSLIISANYLPAFFFFCHVRFLPSGSVVKNLPANAGDPSLIPGLGRSPGEVNDYPLQYSCLENPMDRGAWWATVHGVAELDMA